MDGNAVLIQPILPIHLSNFQPQEFIENSLLFGYGLSIHLMKAINKI